jgi:hypothetical protein
MPTAVLVNVLGPQLATCAADVNGLPIVVEAPAPAGAARAAAASAIPRIRGSRNRIEQGIGASGGGLK